MRNVLLFAPIYITGLCLIQFALFAEPKKICRTEKILIKDVYKKLNEYCSNGYWQRNIYDRKGHLISSKDSQGGTVDNYFDQDNNKVYSIRNRDEWFRWKYDSQNRLVSTRNHTGTWSTIIYHKNEKVVTVSTGRVETTKYDFLKREIYYHIDFPSGDVYWRQISYGRNGKVSRHDFQDGSWEIFSYNENDQLIEKKNADGDVWENTYTSFGKLEFALFNGDRTQRNFYDERQRLVKIQFSFEPSSWNGEVVMHYDAFDRLVRKENWNRIETIQYQP